MADVVDDGMVGRVGVKNRALQGGQTSLFEKQ